jgi:two-component system KDP operon response regulator KdpE
VVEDDPAIRRLLEALLASAGHQVIAAVDGAEALTLADELRPAAILLDLVLPGMSGWDVLERLSAAGGPPVVVLTADAAAVPRAREAGAAAAILKPFDIDEVLEVTGRLIG